MSFKSEIPKRAFINAQIIQKVCNTNNWQDALTSVSLEYKLESYNFINQAYLVSLMYCLLVVPKEVWPKKRRITLFILKLKSMNYVVALMALLPQMKTLKEIFHIIAFKNYGIL